MLGYPESERPGGGAVAGLPGIPDAAGWRGSLVARNPRCREWRGCWVARAGRQISCPEGTIGQVCQES